MFIFTQAKAKVKLTLAEGEVAGKSPRLAKTASNAIAGDASPGSRPSSAKPKGKTKG